MERRLRTGSRIPGLSHKEKCIHYLNGNDLMSAENRLEMQYINKYKGSLTDMLQFTLYCVVVSIHYVNIGA